MYKVVSCIASIVASIVIIIQNDKIIDTLIIFFIGGIVPFTHAAVSNSISILLILSLLVLIYLMLGNLKQSVLKRNAILYSANTRHKKITEKRAVIFTAQDNIKSSTNMLPDTDDLRLVNN